MQQDEYLVIGGKVLGGKSYSLEEYPPQWKNYVPLLYPHLHIASSQIPFIDPKRCESFLQANAIDIAQFPIERFPLIEDFEVLLWTTISNWDNEESEKTYEVHFFSLARGFLARLRFREYTPKELIQSNFKIPVGNFQMPYYDFDQRWALLIAEQSQYIYILQGSLEEILEGKGYYTWFKVDRDRYYSQWQQAIQLCHNFYGK